MQIQTQTLDSINTNLNLYQIFYTVANTGNISQASKELFVSQPAISKSIAKLEQTLETTLFTRSTRGVKLTPAGEILYEQIAKAFDAINIGEKKLQMMHDLGVDHITIGVSNTLCKYVLLPTLKKFIDANPHMKVTIKCQSTAQTINDIENEKIDLGLIGEPNQQHESNLTFKPYMEIRDEFVTTKNYLKHLSERSPLNQSAILQNGDFWMLDKDNITRQYIDSFLTKQNIDIPHILETNTMDLLVEFAKIDMGIACVITNFVEDEIEKGSLIRLPFKIDIPKRNIGFAWNVKNTSTGLTKFLNLLS